MATNETLEFVARIDRGEDGLDVMLYLSETHRVAVWTARLPTRREIVGLEAMPLDGRTTPQLVAEWLMPQLVALNKVKMFRPSQLPSSLIRQGVSFRQVMRDRAEDLGRGVALDRAYGPHSVGVTGASGRAKAAVAYEELALAESLLDAVIYVAAVRDGVSPVVALSKHRTISPRTAEGRIVNSRKNGLLTPAVGKRAAGQLTAYAEDLLTRLEAVGQGIASIKETPNG